MSTSRGKTLIASEFPALASPEEKVRAGAFADLVRTNQQREMNYLRSKHGILSDHLLEQLVGDAFRTLWKAIEAGDADWASKWTWAYFRGILRRRGMDEYKKQKRAADRFGEHQRKVVTSTDDLDIYGAAQPRLIEREVQSNALRAVDAAMSTLPVQQRRVAEILRDNRDAKIGPKEVIALYRQAHGVTLTPAAAKSSMSVVRAKLRAALEQVKLD